MNRAERFKNQLRIISPSELAQKSFLVIGAGAIGSFVVTTLAKMGAKDITVFDHDRLEDHNVANQFYPHKYAGQHKVKILKSVVKEFSEETIVEHPMMYEPRIESERQRPSDFIIVAVDSMDTRKDIWESSKHRQTGFYIDARMGAQVYKVYTVDMTNKQQKEYYESTITSTARALNEPCAQKSIIFTVLGVSAQVLNQIKKCINKERRPFEIVYDFVNNIQTTED